MSRNPKPITPWKWSTNLDERLNGRLSRMVERLDDWLLERTAPDRRRVDICEIYGGKPCGKPSPDNSGFCVQHKKEFEGIAGDVTALLKDLMVTGR